MPKKPAFKPVIQPSFGLIYDRPELAIPPRGLVDGLNFRLVDGSISTGNLGWSRFLPDYTFNGPVMLIASFPPHDQQEFLIIATPTDIYAFDSTNEDVRFLTPTYTTGTVTASGTTVTGAGTAWLSNVQIGDEITAGASDDPNAIWVKITAVNSDTSLDLDGGFPGPDGTYTIRTLFNGTPRDAWDWTVFVGDADSGDDLFFMTNGVDPVVTWNGTDQTATLHPELGFRCKALTSWSNMLIYGNLYQVSTSVSYPTSIINSDVGRPLKAGDVGTGLSEQFRVQDNVEPIVVMLPLADNLVIYAKRTITVVQFVGDPLVFAFRNAANGYGAVGHQALADFGDHHEFIHLDGQYSFDGVGLKEINTHVWREITKQADPNRLEFIWAHFDEQQAELIWAVPTGVDPGTDPDRGPAFAWSEHYLETFIENEVGIPHSKRQFPFRSTGYYRQKTGTRWEDLAQTWENMNFSWSDQFFQLAYPLNLVGSDDGKIYIINSQNAGDTTPLPSFAQFGKFSLGSGRERGMLRRVYPFVEQGSGSFGIRPSFGDSAGQAMTDYGPTMFSLVQPQEGHFVSIFHRGRFAALRFEALDGTPWVLSGYDLDIDYGGSR